MPPRNFREEGLWGPPIFEKQLSGAFLDNTTGRVRSRLALSYRFAEQVVNSKLAIKQEIEDLLTSTAIDLTTLLRPGFNAKVDNPRNW